MLAAVLHHDSDDKVVVDLSVESDTEDEADKVVQVQPSIKTNPFYSLKQETEGRTHRAVLRPKRRKRSLTMKSWAMHQQDTPAFGRSLALRASTSIIFVNRGIDQSEAIPVGTCG